MKKCSMDDLMDAFASLPFRQRRQAKMLAHQRGISVEEMLLEIAMAGLKNVRLEKIRADLLHPMDAGHWRLIDQRLARLGWTRERLDAFLHSSESTVPGGTIRTLGDANRVLLALRRAEEQK
jgi:hypothetical protein